MSGGGDLIKFKIAIRKNCLKIEPNPLLTCNAQMKAIRTTSLAMVIARNTADDPSAFQCGIQLIRVINSHLSFIRLPCDGVL